MAFKKKLYAAGPALPEAIATHRTVACVREAPADPPAIERGVRQMLADKVCGTHVGLWLLIPEYLRQGTWDLLQAWSGQPEGRIQTRLALQLVNEAALCVGAVRARRCLSLRGFELACGLPFVAADQPIHDLLDAHSVGQAVALQTALGMIRRSLGHFTGDTLAVDPHRMRSYSKRQMRLRKGVDTGPAQKASQTFFALDADTCQPVCFTSGTSAVTACQATPPLLALCQSILQPTGRPLVLLDAEHYSADLFRHARSQTPFDLLVPLPQSARLKARIAQIPPGLFTPRWAGFATATVAHRFAGDSEDFHLLVQRCGERPEEQSFKAFLSTRPGDEVEALCQEFPKRWHVEEFLNANQSLGWKRAGTLNLNVRYGQMTMALLAQSALHALRTRLGEPWKNAEASCLARDLLGALDGDIRVHNDTVRVTFYNAPNAEKLRPHYENLPTILESQGVDPRVPWLYNFKLDFRFT